MGDLRLELFIGLEKVMWEINLLLGGGVGVVKELWGRYREEGGILRN